MTEPNVNTRINEVRNAFAKYADDGNKRHIEPFSEVDLKMAVSDTNYFFNSNEGYLKGLVKCRLNEIEKKHEFIYRNIEKLVWIILGFVFGLISNFVG